MKLEWCVLLLKKHSLLMLGARRKRKRSLWAGVSSSFACHAHGVLCRGVQAVVLELQSLKARNYFMAHLSWKARGFSVKHSYDGE
eukprot:4997861-Amphidinium_carterae.1